MSGRPTATAWHRLADAVEHLFPAYFALVMATGIVSIAAHLLEMPSIAWILLAVNLGAYAVLTAMLVFRLLLYFPRVVEDLNNHARGPGFFTVVAATCVLGTEIVILTGRAEAAQVLWLAGIVLWVVVMYAFFTAAVVGETKPSLETGINGAWLLGIVATQSVSVLGTLLSPGMGAAARSAVLRAVHVPRWGPCSTSRSSRSSSIASPSWR
jgi:tellurite resistance protein TehA-like permease